MKGKKHENLPMINTIIFTTVIIIASVYFLREWDQSLSFFTAIVFGGLSVIVSVILSVLLHEIGHLLAGFISGYSFIMLRIFIFMWVKTDNRIELKKQFIPNILGQAMMVPPTDKEYPPYKLYNLGGILMNFILLVLSTVILINTGNSFITNFSIVFAIINLVTVLLNTLPAGPNDGMNLYRCWKSKNQQKQMKQLLIINALLIKGRAFSEIYGELYFDDKLLITDDWNAYMQSIKGLRYLEEFEFFRARKEFYKLVENFDDLFEPYKTDAAQNYLFTLLLTEPDHSDIPKIIGGKYFQPFMNSERASIKRIYASYLFYVNNNRLEAQNELNIGKRWIENIPVLSYQKLEEKIYLFLGAELKKIR